MFKYIYPKSKLARLCDIRSNAFSGSASLNPPLKSDVPEIPKPVRSGLEVIVIRS